MGGPLRIIRRRDADMNARRDQSELVCPHCHYNLTALQSNRCPECGERFVLTRAEDPPEIRSFVLTPMSCPDCGAGNSAFMPTHCKRCGYRFSLAQRIFGVNWITE